MSRYIEYNMFTQMYDFVRVKFWTEANILSSLDFFKKNFSKESFSQRENDTAVKSSPINKE